MEQRAHWQLPQDLQTLRDVVITYAVGVNAATTEKQEKTSQGPVSYSAFRTLHRSAIVVHRSICSLCEAGWTPATPILIRTLLDILASSYAIASKCEDAEYMSFKFLGSSHLQTIKDPDTTEDLRAADEREFNKLRLQMKGKDIERVDELIKNYKPQPYWYRPEFYSPGAIIKKVMPQLFPMYRYFSGSTHGGFIGSLLFNDSPDAAGIDPEEHPIRTASAVVASSRLLLDVSWARGDFSGVTDVNEYKQIVRTFIQPQQTKPGMGFP